MLEYLEKLKEQCIAKPEPYEERRIGLTCVARRRSGYALRGRVNTKGCSGTTVADGSAQHGSHLALNVAAVADRLQRARVAAFVSR